MKNFVRGMGIGILVFAVFSYIIFAFEFKTVGASMNKSATLSEDEIISKAKELGFVSIKDLPKQAPQTELSDEQIISKAKALGMDFTPKNIEKTGNENGISDIVTKTQESDTDTYVKITITAGLSATKISQLLFDNKLIDDKDSFRVFLQEKKVTTLLRTGVHYIPYNSSYDEILKILQARPK